VLNNSEEGRCNLCEFIVVIARLLLAAAMNMNGAIYPENLQLAIRVFGVWSLKFFPLESGTVGREMVTHHQQPVSLSSRR